MSLYPPPNPYSYSHWLEPDPRGPAQRAGVLMLVLGVLGVLFAGCLGIIPLFKDVPEFRQAMAAQLSEQQLDFQTVMLGFVVLAVIVLLWSIAQIALGIVVRRGTTVPVAMALALTAVSMLALLVFLVISLAGGDIGGIACNVIVAALLALQLTWLIQALRQAGRITAMQSGYRAWDYGPMLYPPATAPGPGHGYGYGQPAASNVPPSTAPPSTTPPSTTPPATTPAAMPPPPPHPSASPWDRPPPAGTG